MSYTASALVGIVLAGLVDLVILRTQLLRRKVFWVSYAIIVVFQLIVNGILTGRGIVTYDRHAILGLRIAYAPVEDLLFGFSLVVQTLSWWVWWGRRLPGRATGVGSPPARPRRRRAGRGRAGPPT